MIICRSKRVRLLATILCILPLVHGYSDHIDESIRKAISRSFPDPFTMLDGSMITSPEQWYAHRRDELKQLFQYHVYGYMPDVPQISIKTIHRENNIFNGLAHYRELEISFPEMPERLLLDGKELKRPRIIVSLYLPANSQGPSPVFLTINRCGNHTVSDYRGVSIFPDAWVGGGCSNSEAGRGSHRRFWSVEYIVSRGYAVATFHESDIDTDKDDFSDGVHPFYQTPDSTDKNHDKTRWGTIAAWAWGVSRVIDSFRAVEEIDSEKIVAVGHSRRGKSILLAAAFDERISLAIPHQAGTGAEALSRGFFQEPVFIMNMVYPYWFNDVFKTYNFRISRLPVDQHELLALVAPRGLLLTAAKSYAWAGYRSSHKAMREADAVFKLLGAPGMAGNGIIKEGEKITRQNATGLTQYRRQKGHSLDPEYWKVFVDYAESYFGNLARRQALASVR